MSTKTGFFSNGGTPFVYLQDSNGASVAAGLDSTGSDVFKISVSTSANAVPTTSPQFLIDPSTNGNVTLTPNGTGKIVASYMTTGFVVSDSTGHLTTTSSPSGVVLTVTGNTGGAISPSAGNINILTANSNIKFAGSGSTETLDFGATSNIALGSSITSLSTGTHNTGLGTTAMGTITGGQDMTAIGWGALSSITAGNSNTAIGSESLFTLNTGAGAGYNTVLGAAAGFSLATGQYNTLMGVSAGLNYTGAESSNILINHEGVLGESNTLRIGATTGAGNLSLTAAYICGINGVNVGSTANVVTMVSDQLGTATITAGTNISVSPGANSITISGTGLAGFSWITTAGGTASVNTGYFTSNGASLVTITLPSTANVGDTIRISGLATGGWKLAQNAGQSVNVGSTSTTIGTGGSLASTAQFDSIEIICCVANTTFNIVSSMGNITII